jgi:hypothetical protein
MIDALARPSDAIISRAAVSRRVRIAPIEEFGFIIPPQARPLT